MKHEFFFFDCYIGDDKYVDLYIKIDKENVIKSIEFHRVTLMTHLILTKDDTGWRAIKNRYETFDIEALHDRIVLMMLKGEDEYKKYFWEHA